MDRQPVKTVDQLYPRIWIKPEDLKGNRLTLKIATAHVREIGQRGNGVVLRLVLELEYVTGNRAGQPVAQQLWCNKTQTLSLAEILGSPAFADWPGHIITLAPVKARNGNPTIAILPAEAPTSVVVTEPAEQEPGTKGGS